MQQRLRHSRPELTMNIYTKIRGDDHQAAVLQALPDLAATG
jgi:hypothetical protein